MCRAVATAGILQTNGEVILLEGVGRRADTANENALLSIGPVIFLEQACIVGRQFHTTTLTLIDDSFVCQSSLMPALFVVGGIEQRACIVEGSTSLQCENCQVVGTTSLVLALQLHVSKVGIILYDEVLDGIALRVDELEDFIRALTWLNVCLIGIHSGSNQGNTAKHANQSEIVVSTQETSLILQVLELSQLLFVVEVGQIVLERLILELVEEEVGIANTTPALSPGRSVIVVGSVPTAIIEFLNGVTRVTIY